MLPGPRVISLDVLEGHQSSEAAGQRSVPREGVAGKGLQLTASEVLQLLEGLAGQALARQRLVGLYDPEPAASPGGALGQGAWDRILRHGNATEALADIDDLLALRDAPKLQVVERDYVLRTEREQCQHAQLLLVVDHGELGGSASPRP